MHHRGLLEQLAMKHACIKSDDGLKVLHVSECKDAALAAQCLPVSILYCSQLWSDSHLGVPAANFILQQQLC